MNTATRYAHFARVEALGNSASYVELATAVSEDPAVLEFLDALPEAKRQPNLLFAAVRYLGGPVGSFRDFRAWVLGHGTSLGETMLLRRTQTNEPGRQATLLPLLARLPGPLALLEVGASAGLCLYPDRWSYDYGGVAVGDPRQPVLPCAVSGPVPIPAAIPEIRWRAGLDLNPLDVTDDDDVHWLECLVWPEQEDRLARCRQAIAIARDEPPHLVEGDLVTDLAALAARAPSEATLVVFHSAVLAYVPPDRRTLFVDQVRALDCHWISNEAPSVVPGIDVDIPDGPARFLVALDGRPLAWAGPHGQSLDWS